jgi:hypothetical protein
MPPGQSTTRAAAPQQGTQQAAAPAPAPAVAPAGGNQAACGNLPTAKLSLSCVPVPPIVIASPGGVATAKLTLGGELTAKETCSSNPATVTVSPEGGSVSGGGASVGTNGTAKLTRELQGLSGSVSVNLNSGRPTVTIGSAGTFGSTETSAEWLPTGAIKTTYTCTSRDVRYERNGVQITGNISYSLEVIFQPAPQAPWYQRTLNWLADSARSVGDWLYGNRREILVGVGVAALVVGAAVVIVGTGGAAAPAFAPALAS